MARPGFVIPNAADATKSGFIAEPDAGDFDILGKGTYGIYLGCDYILNYNQFSIVSPVNVFVIQGKVYVTKLDGSSQKVPGSAGVGNQSRFDLLGYRLANGVPALHLVQGFGSNERPVFPEIPDDMLVIASVYIPGAMGEWPATTDLNEYATDKRVFLLSGSKGVATPTEPFVVSTDPSTGLPNFTMRGDGTMIYANGASIKPDGDRRLTITETVYANNLAGTDLNISVDGNFGGNVYANNLVRGDGPPNDITTDGDVGSIYQDTLNGHLYVKNADGHWDLLVPDGYPTGTIMPSILGASFPWLRGMWLLCDGSTVSAEEAGNLWNVAPSLWKDVAAQRLTLPDLRERVLMGAKIPGSIGETGGENDYVLNENHLPRHTHDITVGKAGGHLHTVATDNAGHHSHSINDPGHQHYPNWWPNPNTQFISVEWGGRYGLFGRQAAWDIARFFWPNPANEPDAGTAVDQNPGTLLGYTGVTVGGAPDHSHSANTSAQDNHDHVVTASQAGVQSKVNNTQQYMTINYFIKN